MKRRILSVVLVVVLVCGLAAPAAYAQEPEPPRITADMLQNSKAERGTKHNVAVPSMLMKDLAGVANESMTLMADAIYLGYDWQLAWILVFKGTISNLSEEPVFSGCMNYDPTCDGVQIIKMRWTPTKTGSYVMVTATTDYDNNLYLDSINSTAFNVGTTARHLNSFGVKQMDANSETRVEGNKIFIKPGATFWGGLDLNPYNTTDDREMSYDLQGDCVESLIGGGDFQIYGAQPGVATLSFGVGYNCSLTCEIEVCTSLWGHVMQETRQEPTCTQPGYLFHSCVNCGYIYRDELPAKGHKWVLTETLTAPTVEEQGLGRYACSRCGETKEEVLPSLTETFNAFTDIPENAWYYSATQYAVYNGLFNGASATTFEPESTMTRAMLVTVLWRYEGKPAAGAPDFADVPAGQWYAEAVAWASGNGIVNGVGHNKFEPDSTITREQMAAILYRYAKMREVDTTAKGDFAAFVDADKVSTYAAEALQWCVGEGIITGNSSAGKLYLQPQNEANRAQVAAILMRFIENVMK